MVTMQAAAEERRHVHGRDRIEACIECREYVCTVCGLGHLLECELGEETEVGRLRDTILTIGVSMLGGGILLTGVWLWPLQAAVSVLGMTVLGVGVALAMSGWLLVVGPPRG